MLPDQTVVHEASLLWPQLTENVGVTEHTATVTVRMEFSALGEGMTSTLVSDGLIHIPL